MEETNPLKEPSSPEFSPVDNAGSKLIKLLEQWDKVEALIEQDGRANKLVESTQEYINDLRSEIKSIGRMRWIILVVNFLYLLILNGTLLYLLFYDKVFFIVMGSYAKVTIIALVISSSAILLGKMLSGVLKTYDERHKEDHFPPHIKQIVDVINLHSEANTSVIAGERYHFDYSRLLADLAQVRTGIQTYLAPSRAQPRDLTELSGDYRREQTLPNGATQP